MKAHDNAIGQNRLMLFSLFQGKKFEIHQRMVRKVMLAVALIGKV
jgi:hypothetical protein